MKEEELTHLQRLRQASRDLLRPPPTWEKRFCTWWLTRTGERLAAWLEEGKERRLEAFASVVGSRATRHRCVLAGLTLPWRTGPRDRHINRLKLSKRELGTVAASVRVSSGFACSTILQREKWLKTQRQEPIISDGGIVPRS